jgi:N-acetylglucosaminyldiphosphoundecaprenol N-acetyl-beta-D-mannosaminyltransferase
MTASPPWPRVRVGRATVDALSFEEAVEEICALAVVPGPRSVVVTPNIQHIAMLRTDDAFVEAYERAALVLPDGFPVCAVMGLALGRQQSRVTGADLLPAVCREAATRRLSVGLLGGHPGAGEEAARRLCRAIPGLDITLIEPAPRGFEHSPEELARVLAGVVSAAPALLFVGLGAPKGELFLTRHAERLGGGVALSVGAALDFQAGYVQRAPDRWQRVGLEWLWRIRQEPRRLAGRYLRSMPLFVLAVAPTVWRWVLRRPSR